MDATDPISVPLAEPFRSSLTALLAAFDYAADSRADRWEFAIDLSDLFARGATLSDIRWLIHRGLAEHAKETTTPGDPHRSFRPLVATSYPADACLTLTPTGAASLRAFLRGREASAPNPPQSGAFPDPQPLAASPSARPWPLTPSPLLSAPSPLPCWDPPHRELRYAGQVIKRFRQPAKNQEAILASFQEEGWPAHIDDPLFGGNDQDAQERLHNAIKRLNCQEIHLVNFLSDGKGQGVLWEPRNQPDQLRPMSDPLQQDCIIRNMSK